MDIPAPKKEPEESKITVKTAPATKAEVPAEEVAVVPAPSESSVQEQPAPVAEDKPIPQKDDATAESEEKLKSIAKLIEEKTYFLPIKEKRPPNNLVLFSAPKHSKKIKKVAPKKQEEKKSSHQALLVIVLVVVLIATVFAIDAGMVDIGVKLPFDLIKNT